MTIENTIACQSLLGHVTHTPRGLPFRNGNAQSRASSVVGDAQIRQDPIRHLGRKSEMTNKKKFRDSDTPESGG